MFKSLFGKKEKQEKKIAMNDTKNTQEIVYRKQNDKIAKVSDDALAKAIKDILKK